MRTRTISGYAPSLEDVKVIGESIYKAAVEPTQDSVGGGGGSGSHTRYDEAARTQFDTALQGEFEVSPWDSGEASYVLGMNVKRDVCFRLTLSQGCVFRFRGISA